MALSPDFIDEEASSRSDRWEGVERDEKCDFLGPSPVHLPECSKGGGPLTSLEERGPDHSSGALVPSLC